MWYHKKYGVFLGSYDYDKSGKRFFELIGMWKGRKRRYKFATIKEATDEKWQQVKSFKVKV